MPSPIAGRQADFQFGIQRDEDVFQLRAKGFLVEDVEQIGDVIVLADGPFLLRQQLEEDVAGKQRFAKHDRLAAILVGRIVAGQRGGETLALAVLDQLLFATGFGMGDEPQEF